MNNGITAGASPEPLREYPPIGHNTASPVMRAAAKGVSILFHPVFVPVYVMAFLLYIHPFLFAGFSSHNKMLVLVQSILMMTFFPLVTVLLLKGVGFIKSVYLRTQRDRVIPIIACMTWYFWIAYVWRNMGKSNDTVPMPREIVYLAAAMFLTTVLALMINITMKVSLHAIAVGVALTFLFQLAITENVNFAVYLSVAILVTGLVCTARLIASDHTQREVYTGLLTGVAAMAAAPALIGLLG